jgi:hypothetical protein
MFCLELWSINETNPLDWLQISLVANQWRFSHKQQALNATTRYDGTHCSGGARFLSRIGGENKLDVISLQNYGVQLKDDPCRDKQSGQGHWSDWTEWVRRSTPWLLRLN